MTIQLHTVGVVVRNMGESLAFYRHLVLPVPEGQDAEDNVEAGLPNGITLGFLSEVVARQADPTFTEPVSQRINLQFACESAAEVDAIHTSLVAAGYISHTDPWDAYWGQRFARIKDADGNVVNLFA